MKNLLKENKKIKLELNKMIDESNQICRILDKDDVDVENINIIGKKTYLKTPNPRNKKFLPNLIYHQGQLADILIHKNNSNKKAFKGIFSHNSTKSDFFKKKNTKKINDFHSNFFKILKGSDNEKIINNLFFSENYGKAKFRTKKEEKKVENKLKLIVHDIMEKKNILTKRLPLYIKKFKKDYEYINNQLILDEINEKRYVKYDDPFKYSLNKYLSSDILPKYNNLFFKYEKNKIRDHFYRKTYSYFHSSKNNNNNNNNKGYSKEITFNKTNFTNNSFNNK